MKMIAASRLRKAHDRIIAARPFSKSMVRVLSSLAGRVDAATHPLLAARNDREPGAHILRKGGTYTMEVGSKNVPATGSYRIQVTGTPAG